MKILIEKAVVEQALKALEQWKEHDAWHKRNDWNDEDESAITALREALDPELQFVRDWNEGKVHRVSDGKVMGFAEQAEGAIVKTCPDGYGTITTEQAEQEPVAIGSEWKPCMKLPVVVHVREQREGESHVSTREGITPVRPDDLIMRGVAGEEYPIGRELFNRTYTFDTAAPVRTKDLTDDEVAKAYMECTGGDIIARCRAVIAADRENKK